VEPLPPSFDRRGRFGGTTIVLIVLLALVAISSRSGFGSSGGTTVSNTYVSYAMSVFLIVFVLMIPVAIYSYVMRTKELGPEAREPRKRSWRLIIGLVLFTGLGFLVREWLKGHHGFFHPDNGLFGGHHKLGPGAKLKDRPGATPQPHFEYSVLWVSLAIGAIIAVAAVVAWIRRPPPEPTPERTMREDVVATIDDAIDDLEREPDPRRAVIAAYARMERVLGRHGLARKQSETAIEYLRRVLGDLTSSGDAVGRLTSLFEQAKFSSHQITEPMKHDAIASLREIRAGMAE
jgi:hypothetical protein